MGVTNWFVYVTTVLLSTGFHSKEIVVGVLGGDLTSSLSSIGGNVVSTGDLITSCLCYKTTEDGEVDADEENKQILRWHSPDGDISQFMRVQSVRTITSKETNFTLYSRDNMNGTRIFADNPDGLKGIYHPEKPTVVAAHGFQSSDKTEWMRKLKEAQLKVLDCNFVSIDWSKCASSCCYFGARDCAIIVGGYLEQFLRTFIRFGTKPSRIHLMGHSLGAHLVAQSSAHGLHVARISGFDPPQWGFDNNNLTHRLDPRDAHFVDVIHTTATLGWDHRLGDKDFFPNGGNHQPGCFLNEACGHSMSYWYYIDTLQNPHKYEAKRCRTLQTALSGFCLGQRAYMGVNSYKGKGGSYFLTVKEAAASSKSP